MLFLVIVWNRKLLSRRRFFNRLEGLEASRAHVCLRTVYLAHVEEIAQNYVMTKNHSHFFAQAVFLRRCPHIQPNPTFIFWFCNTLFLLFILRPICPEAFYLPPKPLLSWCWLKFSKNQAFFLRPLRLVNVLLLDSLDWRTDRSNAFSSSISFQASKFAFIAFSSSHNHNRGMWEVYSYNREVFILDRVV